MGDAEKIEWNNKEMTIFVQINNKLVKNGDKGKTIP